MAGCDVCFYAKIRCPSQLWRCKYIHMQSNATLVHVFILAKSALLNITVTDGRSSQCVKSHHKIASAKKCTLRDGTYSTKYTRSKEVKTALSSQLLAICHFWYMVDLHARLSILQSGSLGNLQLGLLTSKKGLVSHLHRHHMSCI